ncbi:MAG TPA: RnfABCDGE type electron transport complex subunit D, partial [Haploplasma sp.]|nr:RnfABCDGE type electron transport complex subunit D [Haploplasma sp.]
MQAIRQTAPYVRKDTSTKSMMIDVLVALLPVVIFAIFRFKTDFIFRALLSVGLAVAIEAVAFALMKEKNETLKARFKNKYTINNIVPPIITGLIFVLTVPSKASYILVAVGISVAMIIGKMIFGGLGKNVFNPAGLGRAFVALAMGGLMGSYIGIDGSSGSTALGDGTYTILQLFLGQIPGSMGEISALAIILGGIYLLVRRSADFRVIVSSLLTFSLIMLSGIIGKGVVGTEIFKQLLIQILSGGLLFGVVFMATDPVTSPYTRPGRIIFGSIIGVLVAVIRLFGSLPEGMVFALLIANAFVALIDYKR